MAQAYAYGFRLLAQRHTRYIVQRPQGLPTGAARSDMASR